MVRPSFTRIQTVRTLPWLVLALLIGVFGCKNGSFRGANSGVTPEEQPQGGPSSSATTPGPQGSAPAQGTETASNVIAEVQSKKVEREEPRRDSFIEALIAAGLTVGSQLFESHQSAQPQSSQQPQQCGSGAAAGSNRALDVVFSIDVSTSMNPYIQVVKENVKSFAGALELEGINARVAAVGFVNAPLQTIDFTNSSAFQTTISGWRTIENGNIDMQEGGQSSLEHALWMLSAAEVGARPGVAKAIIHISDAVAFAGENHEDFSVTKLAAAFRAARNQFGSLLFFDSVPTSFGESGPNLSRKRLSFSPRMQMNDLRQQSQNLGGGPIPFPFLASTMTIDLPQGIQSGLAGLPSCR